MKSLLVDAIETNAADHIEQILNNNGMRKVEVLATRITLYATEKPDLLYIEAGEDMLCEDAAGQGRTDAKLYIGVDGYYNVHSEEFSHIRTQSLELVFTDPEGERVTKRGVFLHLGAMEGHRTSVHEIRHKLSE